MMQPLMNVIGNLGYVTVCILGAVMAINGQITIGTIVAFIMYVRLFTSPLSTIAQGMTNLQSAAAAGDRVFDFLQEKEMPDESAKSAAVQPVEGDVVFDHVRFSYPDAPDKVIIKDFSAHVTPGEKVAIVGPTGAGKTTMVNLLMKFFDIQSGQIRIDGIPISDMKRESVHDMFSMVLQDTWMFDGTVRENLVYNRTGITDDMLEKACRACGIFHFIETLPKGFDTVLGENITVSAGQKQLLTIARAMVQNNPMLILDEATSSVDTRTELITQKAMDQLMAHRTSFVIAHRLSTIRNADLILVMKDGNIIEQGTHQQLLDQGGFYAELYNSQFDQSAS
jgi:ATP-binding cassette subfamily B protein